MADTRHEQGVLFNYGNVKPVVAAKEKTFLPPAVSLKTRSESLRRAIFAIGEVSIQPDYRVTYGGDPEQQRRASDVATFLEGNDLLRNAKHMHSAEVDFKMGFGKYALRGSHVMTKQAVDEMTAEAFQEFLDTYAGSDNSSKRQDYTDTLTTSIARLNDPIQEQKIVGRLNLKRPYFRVDFIVHSQASGREGVHEAGSNIQAHFIPQYGSE